MNRNTANRVWTGIDKRFQVRGWTGTVYWLARNEFGIPEPRREIELKDNMTVAKVRRVAASNADVVQGVVLDGCWQTELLEPEQVAVVAPSWSHPARIGFNSAWFAGLHHIACDQKAELRLDVRRCYASWWRDDRLLAMLAGYYTPVRQIPKAAA